MDPRRLRRPDSKSGSVLAQTEELVPWLPADDTDCRECPAEEKEACLDSIRRHLVRSRWLLPKNGPDSHSPAEDGQGAV